MPRPTGEWALVLSIGVMRASAWEYYSREIAGGLEDYYGGGGEAPGMWTGRGADAAGIAGEVSADALELAFGQARHPVTRGRLGRPWREPDGVTGLDLTFSAPKSVSVLFAIGGPELREAVRAAHVAAVDEAGLAYLEDHGAFTRRGHNGVMVRDTEGLVVARFEHRASRALDPQLHSHCLVLNKVRDPLDGAWRALDGRAIFEEAKTAGMLYQAALRAELTKRLGVSWRPANAHGQADLAGIPEEQLERFSKRTAAVEAAAEAKVAELEAALGRPLEAAERGRVYRLAVLATRAPKDHAGLDDQALSARWTDEVRAAGFEPAALVHQVLDPPAPPASRSPVVGRDRWAGIVLGEATAERATFARRDVVQAIARRLDVSAGADAEMVRTRVEELADALLARPDVVCLQAPEHADPPPVLVRRDGWSVWDPPQAIRYTTRQMLSLEGRILHAAAIGRAARAAIIDETCLDHALALEARPLGSGQLAALRAITSRGRRVEAVIGPAGSGKTTMLRVAARAWHAAGHQVIGLAHTAVAAEVLRSDAEVPAETLAKFLHSYDHNTGPPVWRLSSRHVVVLDEASMVNTRQLDQLVDLVSRRGAKLVLVGDDRQLGAIGAPGGMFTALAEELGATELRDTHRFAHAWEAHALSQLRRGDGAWLEGFANHGRVHGGTEPQARSDLFGRWWAAHLAGRDAIMLTPDHSAAGDLALRARAARVLSGEVSRVGLRVHTDSGRQTIGVGDHVETRRNNRRLTYGPGPDQWVRNHDRWHVITLDQHNGTLTVEHLRHHARLTLPADYTAHHVCLAYGATIASAQGLTVDETHVLVTPSMYASELYTALSRGRLANHAYAACEPRQTQHTHGQPGPPSPAEVLARVAQRERPDWAAHGVLRRSMHHAQHPDVLRARILEVIRTMQRMPASPDRDALDAYRQRLAHTGRTTQHQPPRTVTPPERAPRLAPPPPGLGIEL